MMKDLYDLLARKNLKLSVAESCTGGLISSLITDVPGASRYFIGSLIAYDNDVKIKILKVPEEVLIKYGAVSPQTAHYMAVNVKKLFNTDIGLSTTCIAGPTGATPIKSVGLTYVGISFKDTSVKEYRFTGARLEIKTEVSNAALTDLYQILAKK